MSGGLLGPCSKLSYQLLYVSGSSTSLQKPPERWRRLGYKNSANVIYYIRSNFLFLTNFMLSGNIPVGQTHTGKYSSIVDCTIY